MGWLKFCYSFAESGVNVITGDLIGALDHGIEAVKIAYNAYHEEDRTQQSLDAQMRAPLLLPTEEEQLIQSLRDQKFFDDFKYDSQRGQWVAIAKPADAVAVDAVQLNVAEFPVNRPVPPLQRQSSVLRDLEALGMRGFHEGELDLLARALEDLGFDTSESLRGVANMHMNVLIAGLERQGAGFRCPRACPPMHTWQYQRHSPPM